MFFLSSAGIQQIGFGRRLSLDNRTQILPLGKYCGLFQRLDSNFLLASVVNGLIPERVDAEEVGEIEDALVAVGIVGGTGALADGGASLEQVSSHCSQVDGLELRVEVLHEPVDADVVAVVLALHHLAHFLEQLQFGVVELHEMATHEGQPHQSQRKHLFLLSPAVGEASRLRVFEESHRIGDDGSYAANCVVLPHLESSFQLIAVDHHVVVDDEVDLRLALWRDLIAPVHGVAGSLEEVDRSLPGGLIEFDGSLFWFYLVVPDDVEVGGDGAVESGVVVDVLLDDFVVIASRVGDRDEGETKSHLTHLSGTFSQGLLDSLAVMLISTASSAKILRPIKQSKKYK